jgi:adenylate kinase family enzyme
MGEALQLPVIHLDAELWRPGWIMTPKDEELALLQNWIAGESWIIDGNYGATMSQRFAAADTILFLDFPRSLCLWRAVRRFLRYRGRRRPDMAEGCPEKLDWEFLKWIWSFPRTQRPLVLQRIAEYSAGRDVFIFRRPREVKAFRHALKPMEH